MKIEATVSEEEIPLPRSHLPIYINGSRSRIRWLKHIHKRRRPDLNSSSLIKSYRDMRKALISIKKGVTNEDQYHCADGQIRAQLKLAQSLRDGGVPYKVRDILSGKIEADFNIRAYPTSHIQSERAMSSLNPQ